MITEDQIKQVNAEIAEKKATIDRINKSDNRKPIQDKRDKIEMAANSHKAKHATIKMNVTKTENQKLREQIDMLRKELNSKKEESKRLIKMTEKAQTLAAQQNHEALNNQRMIDEHVTQRIALRSKHEEDQARFEIEVEKMHQKLFEKDESIALEERQAEASKTGTDDAQDYKNPIQILKLRLAKIVATNKEKKRLMEQYLRNVKVIEDAFDQIKETTGIQSNDEIVTSFIKAEEQIYALINYVNTLGTETDQLEDQNREIQYQIERIRSRSNMTTQQRDDLKTTMEEEVKTLTEQIAKQ
jgi:coiled-coil domain-containing protein 63/114